MQIPEMWRWTLNWDDITGTLVVGSCPRTVSDLETIRVRCGATALLCLQNGDCFRYHGIDRPMLCREGEALGLVMAHSPMRDFDIGEQRRSVGPAVRKLASLQSAGHKTYVHCTAGLGRAPLTVLTYLSLVEGLGPERAIRLIKEVRSEAVPSWEAYHGFVDDLTGEHRQAIERRAYGIYEEASKGSAEDWARAQIEVLGKILRGSD